MHQLACFVAVMGVGCALPARTVPNVLPSNTENAIAAIEAAEDARLAAAAAGDYETAAQFIAPEFIFVHSTGQVDDLRRFRAFSERVSGAASTSRTLVEAPQFTLDKDLAVRTRLTASRPRPGLPEARYRSLDVFVRRSGQWLWFAHQSATVQPPWGAVSIPESLLNEFAGTYVTTRAQTRVYTTRAGALLQSVLPDGPSDVVLTPLSENTFAVPSGTASVTFLRDKTGKVTRARNWSAPSG